MALRNEQLASGVQHVAYGVADENAGKDAWEWCGVSCVVELAQLFVLPLVKLEVHLANILWGSAWHV
jgi:hypothetical protein